MPQIQFVSWFRNRLDSHGRENVSGLSARILQNDRPDKAGIRRLVETGLRLRDETAIRALLQVHAKFPREVERFAPDLAAKVGSALGLDVKNERDGRLPRLDNDFLVNLARLGGDVGHAAAKVLVSRLYSGDRQARTEAAQAIGKLAATAARALAGEDTRPEEADRARALLNLIASASREAVTLHDGRPELEVGNGQVMLARLVGELVRRDCSVEDRSLILAWVNETRDTFEDEDPFFCNNLPVFESVYGLPT